MKYAKSRENACNGNRHYKRARNGSRHFARDKLDKLSVGKTVVIREREKPNKMDDATKLVEAMKKIAQLEAERHEYDERLNEVTTEARQQREQRQKVEEFAQSLLGKQQAAEKQIGNQTVSQVPGQGGGSNGGSNGNAMDDDHGQASEAVAATETQQLLWTMAQLLQKQVENTAVTCSVVPDSQSTVRDFSSTEDPSYARAWSKELCNAKTVFGQTQWPSALLEHTSKELHTSGFWQELTR